MIGGKVVNFMFSPDDADCLRRRIKHCKKRKTSDFIDRYARQYFLFGITKAGILYSLML